MRSFLVACAIAALSLPMTGLAGSAASETADRHFKNFREQASQVRYSADYLQSFVDNPLISWETHAEELLRIRARIRSMARSYYALKEMDGAMSPEQQESLTQVAAAINLIGSNAGAALDEIGDNQTTPFALNQEYARNIDVIVGQTARILNQTTDNQIASAAKPLKTIAD